MISLFIVLYVVGGFGLGSPENAGEMKNTELSRALDERPLLFATLGGGMVAVEPLAGNIIWKLKDGIYFSTNSVYGYVKTGLSYRVSSCVNGKNKLLSVSFI
ncbi:hypothetical protein evm_014199 [Chilo suppressalis]|nr:hypothetical protein evm_014199 [Chilo suppressalis]